MVDLKAAVSDFFSWPNAAVFKRNSPSNRQ
jgi:hypothetical protein